MPSKLKKTYEQLKEKKGIVPLEFANVWDILLNSFENYKSNGDVNQAAAISLYAILSLIPLFILTMVVVNYIFGSHPLIRNELIAAIREYHPYFSEALLSQLGRVEQKKVVLGWLGIISLIWFSAMIFSAIETAMNIIFRSKKDRNYFVSKLLAIAMIPTGWSVGFVSVGITYLSTIVAKQPLLVKGDFIFLPVIHGAISSYILPYLVMVAFSTIVYKVIPTAKIRLIHAFVAAAVFSAMMEIAKHFFTWYVANYTRYHIIFGSLEAVVILVIWVFYVALIFLFCAELISSYERRDLILLEKAFLKPKKKLMKIDERLFKKFGRMYPKGTYIFNEGDTGDEMYYILIGNVRVEKSAGKIRKVLAELGPGEYFGEMAALIDAPRTASALTTEDSSLAVVNGDTFRNLLRESGEVSVFMLKEFSNRLKHTNVLLEETTQSWIKLITILYFLKEWPLKEGQNPLDELSRYIRKGPEEIRQLLNDLADQGVVIIHDGRIADFIKERAWNLLNKEVFLPDRRRKKRDVDTYI